MPLLSSFLEITTGIIQVTWNLLLIYFSLYSLEMAFSVDLNQICFHDLGKLIIYVKLICLCKYFSYKGCSQLETITENPIFDGIIWNDAKITENTAYLK